MGRTIAIALALFFTLSIIECKGNAMALAKVKSKEITGEIVSVDASKNLLTVKTKKGEMAFSLDEKTKIKMGKETRSISDLKVGDKIKVYYIHVDGKDLAETIMVRNVETK